MTVDEARLAEIRARAEAATPPPWLTPTEAGDPYDVMVIDHEGCPVWPWTEEADMLFAYKAREDIPYLLSIVEAIRQEERSRYEGLLAAAQKLVDWHVLDIAVYDEKYGDRYEQHHGLLIAELARGLIGPALPYQGADAEGKR